jgi:hypothetical protein
VLFSGTSVTTRPGGTAELRGVTVPVRAYDGRSCPRWAIVASCVGNCDTGRVAVLHRVGPVPVGASSVVVAVSAPHRDVAFDAARFGIDTLKATVPIWKKETWADGAAWGLDAQPIGEVGAR